MVLLSSTSGTLVTDARFLAGDSLSSWSIADRLSEGRLPGMLDADLKFTKGRKLLNSAMSENAAFSFVSWMALLGANKFSVDSFECTEEGEWFKLTTSRSTACSFVSWLGLSRAFKTLDVS